MAERALDPGQDLRLPAEGVLDPAVTNHEPRQQERGAHEDNASITTWATATRVRDTFKRRPELRNAGDIRSALEDVAIVTRASLIDLGETPPRERAAR